MTDIRIINVNDLRYEHRENLPAVYNQYSGVVTYADWSLLDGNLDETQELMNVVKVALLTDRLADSREVLPDPDSEDRRGWWGDHEADEVWDGWPIGSRIWLLSRAKITPAEAAEGSTLARAESYIRIALQPMIDKRMCTHIDVVVDRVQLNRIDAVITIYRGPRQEIQLQFQNLWVF